MSDVVDAAEEILREQLGVSGDDAVRLRASIIEAEKVINIALGEHFRKHPSTVRADRVMSILRGNASRGWASLQMKKPGIAQPQDEANSKKDDQPGEKAPAMVEGKAP